MTTAIVIGATGGIGSALVDALASQEAYDRVVALARASEPPLDLLDDASIADAARSVSDFDDIRLVIDATGILSDDELRPEKSLRDIDPAALARYFAINATGPALVMKHFLPLLPRQGRAVFATISARVGSIGENRLGGWYGYRASKAALNQLVRTAAVELARTRRDAVCVAVHPGTVETRLSANFARSGLDVISPTQAASDMLAGLARLTPDQSGGFFDRHGEPLPF